MKQRVALARALAPDPRVLLMDEPFAALDALTREQLYGDLQDIWQSRKTIVFVTHNVREAVCLGDRVILMSPSARPHPRGVRRSTLPRPRDINSPELASHAQKITTALKGYLLGGGRGMRRAFVAALFFAALIVVVARSRPRAAAGRRCCCRRRGASPNICGVRRATARCWRRRW